MDIGKHSLIPSIEYEHCHDTLMIWNGFKFFLKKIRKRLEEFQLFLKFIHTIC
jgi:hypothetical protein